MNRAKRMWQAGLSLLLVSHSAIADWSAVNMTRGVTAISREVYDLHMLIFYVCVVIGVVVFGVMILSMLLHRKSRGAQPATFHESAQAEILWTIAPIVILLAMAVPATNTLRSMYDAGDSDIDIEVRGYQWKWQYTYLDDDPGQEIQFMSQLSTPWDEIENLEPKGDTYLLDVDNPLVIPVNKRVRFLVTSQDVIHAFWVPDFAVKRDAIPGFVHEAWTIVDEPGTYRGQCAELCGKDHGFMPIVVKVVEQDEYDTWIAEKREAARIEFETVGKQWSMDELMERGEDVYLQYCVTCHQVNGQGIPPAFPSLVGQGVSVGPIDAHIDIVLNGKAGSAMQAFGVQLSPAELASVITYERNAWGNGMDDMVQPKEVNDLMAPKGDLR
jgi:cytochrome c oxidase subunit 2